jgi:hypothetical protein
MLVQRRRENVSLLNIFSLYTTPIPNISPPRPRTQKCCQARDMTIYGRQTRNSNNMQTAKQ